VPGQDGDDTPSIQSPSAGLALGQYTTSPDASIPVGRSRSSPTMSPPGCLNHPQRRSSRATHAVARAQSDWRGAIAYAAARASKG